MRSNSRQRSCPQTLILFGLQRRKSIEKLINCGHENRYSLIAKRPRATQENAT